MAPVEDKVVNPASTVITFSFSGEIRNAGQFPLLVSEYLKFKAIRQKQYTKKKFLSIGEVNLFKIKLFLSIFFYSR